MSLNLDRYKKQTLFAGLDDERQSKLLSARVLLCGCGALGSVVAETLVRAGVGFLRIVDRDFVELSNLQRQVLFDEQDVAQRMPKAVAAAEKLRRINSDVTIEAIVGDIAPDTLPHYAEGVDLILDGADNFELRFLINDLSLDRNIPWIYAGVIGSHGQSMTIFPHETACLRCLIESPPDPGSMETCDTAGVIGPAVNVIASLECVDAIKFLSGQRELIEPMLTVVDVWEPSFRRLSLRDLREKGACPACKEGRRDWLRGESGSHSSILCGRNAVQITPATRGEISLEELASKLETSGQVFRNPYLVRLTLNNPDFEVTAFRDGRAIIKGTEDIAIARTIYARYIGS